MGDVNLYALDRTGRRRSLTDACPGQVVVAEIDHTNDQALRRLVNLRRACPWAPMVIATRDDGPEHLTSVGVLARDVAARAVTLKLDAEWPDIVRRLSGCEGLDKHLGRWMTIQRPNVRHLTIKRIEALVACGMNGGQVNDVATDFDITPRDLEDTFHRAQLPRPSRYIRFGRLMPGLSVLALKPATRLIDAADAAGYSTGSAFIRTLTRDLGVHAAEGRARIGFEWVAHAMQLYRRLESQ